MERAVAQKAKNRPGDRRLPRARLRGGHDADLIGYMFWSTLHGIVVLDMAGRLGGEVDADTLRKKTMRTLLAGMAVSPPRRDDESGPRG